jgi:hypothetical protein
MEKILLPKMTTGSADVIVLHNHVSIVTRRNECATEKDLVGDAPSLDLLDFVSTRLMTPIKGQTHKTKARDSEAG